MKTIGYKSGKVVTVTSRTYYVVRRGSQILLASKSQKVAETFKLEHDNCEMQIVTPINPLHKMAEAMQKLSLFHHHC